MAAESLNQVLASWRGRSERERQALVLAALVVLAGVLYGGVYVPVGQSIAKLEKRLPQVRAETRLMKVQVTEIERLRVKAQQSMPANASLAQRVDTILSESGLKDGVERRDSSQSGQVTLVMKAMPASAWLGWLEALDQHGIDVSICQLSHDEKSEVVKPELLTLKLR